MKHEDFMKYEEKKGHGSYLLPFAAYGTIIPQNLTFFPAHWHDEIEIIYAKKGRCRYYINFQPYDMSAGDVIIVPPTVIHSFEQYKDEEFVGFSAVFSLNMVNNSVMDICSAKYFMPIFNNEIILPIHIDNDNINCKDIERLVKNMLACYYKKADGYELELKICILKIFSYFFTNGLYEKEDKKITINKSSDKTKTIISYIENHYSEKITLETLAKITNQSVYNLSHSFKNCTGQSPLDYINKYRLSIAAKQLVTTENPVINIAIDTGFNNVSYFNRAFKSKFHMTPTEYRKGRNGDKDE